MPFARHLIDKLEDMKCSSRGQPEIPMDLPTALETMSAPWHGSDIDVPWKFAGFDEVFTYLRGNKKLDIPDEFRPVIPRTLG